MESSKPSSSAPPYAAGAGAGAGAGGKFRKPPISRKRPSTPYDRPPLTPANKKSDASVEDAGGWLSKLVVNPARRLIVGGATRILPSFFSKSESSSAEEDEYDSSGDGDSEDVDATVNVPSDAKHTLQLVVSNSSRDAGPSNQMDKLKGSSEHANVQQDKSIDDFDQIENMLKGKQLSRDESNRLIEILKSRLADDINAEEKKKAANVSSQGQGKLNELDHEIPTTGKQYDVETPMPRLPSNKQEEVAASPIDIAKAYMGSRALELGVNTYSNISTDRREHEQNVLFPPKPHFLTPSSKSSTCWPGAMVQDHRAYLTPQTQRSRYGLHNFPRTPYSRTKPKLSQLHGDSRPSNVSLTPFQQSQTPNPWQMKKTSSDVMDGGYGSVGPIRRIRNKSVPEPRSEGPRSFAPAQIASSSNASRSFVPVFQKNPATPATSNLYTSDRDKQQTFKNDANSAGPTNETVKKILDQLDRHKPTPKEKAAELKLATEWKSSPSETSNSKMPIFTTTTGPNLQKSGVLNGDGPFQKVTDGGVSVEDPKKASNTTTKPLASGNEAGAGTSFGFKNTGVANEKSTVSNSKENEKSQPWSFDKRINGQELPRKRPSQPTLKPISFKRPDPQQVVSSDNGHGFTFSFSAAATSSASEPPTPSIMPSLPLTATPAAQAKELPGLPTYSFGTKKSSERVVFSFPSTSSAPIGDGVSDLKFNFGSGKKRVSFGSIGSDAIISN